MFKIEEIDVSGCPWCDGHIYWERTEPALGGELVHAECVECRASAMLGDYAVPSGRVSEVEMTSSWYRSWAEGQLWWLLGPGKYSPLLDAKTRPSDKEVEVEQLWIAGCLREHDYGYGPVPEWLTW